MAHYIERAELEEDLLRRLSSKDRSIFLVGSRGSGKTTLLKRLQLLMDEIPTALVQIEPIAASPEILCHRFWDLTREVIPPAPSHEEASYASLLASIARSNTQAILLLDDLTELRTLSYFPGVKKPLESFLETLFRQGPRFVATSRFRHWLASHLGGLPPALQSRSVVLEIPPLTVKDLKAGQVNETERLVAATGGIPVHVQPLLQRMDDGQLLDQALTDELMVGGRMEAECRASLAELLHRARGYGACKAVLHVLAGEEPLALSEIARRMNRTAGSTRDYLRWLEEVELIRVRDKRFSFVDPILRLWLRLYGRGRPPTNAEIGAEILTYIRPAQPTAVGSTRQEADSFSGSDENLIEID